MASTINNGIPLINGMLYSWADIVATINGVPLRVLRVSNTVTVRTW